MPNISLETISQVCRICFTTSTNMKHLYLDKDPKGLSCAELLNLCFSVDVDNNEILPNMVCVSCMEKIHQVYNFKLNFENSNTYWKSYVRNLENPSLMDDEVIKTNENQPENLEANHIHVESHPETELKLTDMIIDDSRIEIQQERKYTCNQCDLVFASHHQLTKHKKIYSHYKRKTFKCKECEKLLPLQNYKSHLVKHATKHICQLCNIKLSNNANLQRHIRTHTKEKPYTCSTCNVRFSRQDKLKSHEEMHVNSINHTDKCHLCTMCGKGFTRKESLRKHHHCVHEKKETIEKTFLCNICANMYSTKHYLQQHIQTFHLGYRAFKCNICKKTFTQLTSLQNHYLIHTGERPFLCKICSKTFNSSCNLKRHVNGHNNIRPFKCSYCSKCFGQKYSLKVHIRIHTGEKPLACIDCNMSFSDPSTLAKHQKQHLNQLLQDMDVQ